MKTLICILLAAQVHATNIYVSPKGSDSDGRTPQTAWKTIKSLVIHPPKPHDSVFFEQGQMWREQMMFPADSIYYGTFGAGGRSIINGADRFTNWQSAGNNWWFIPYSNLHAMVLVSSVVYGEAHSFSELRENKYYIHPAASRLYIFSLTDPSKKMAEVSVREYGFACNGWAPRKNITINGFEFRLTGRAGAYFEGPGESLSDYFEGNSKVLNCTFFANRFFAAASYDHYDGLLISGSVATYNGNAYYAWISSGMTMRNNTSAHSIVYTIYGQQTDGHAYGGYRSDKMLIEGCTSTDDNDAFHIDCGGWDVHGIIRYNKSFNSRFGFGTPNTPTMGIGSLGKNGLLEIYYNLMVNGASTNFEAYTRMLGRVRYYNNTCVELGDYGTDGLLFLATLSNFDMKNNIFFRKKPGKIMFNIRSTDQPLALGSNLYYSGGGSLLNYFGDHYEYSVRQGNLFADPKFVNDSTDWRLQAGSPCINAGENVGLKKDILGHAIIGNPDIGAFEYSSPI